MVALTASTRSGNPATFGVRVTARTRAPAAASSATRGRPTLPVAPVITIVMLRLLRVAVLYGNHGPRGGKVTVGTRNFSGLEIVGYLWSNRCHRLPRSPTPGVDTVRTWSTSA